MEISEQHPACLRERRQAEREGVGNPANLPFYLSPDGAETAVLLVHGFTASPYEMRLLAEHLAAEGVAAHAVRLPGHGTDPADLRRRSWREWLQAVERGFNLLAEDFSTIYGAGMSTGCLLLLHLALEKQFSGLALFSPYLRIRHRLAGHAAWLHYIRPFHVSAEMMPSPYYYARRPVAGVSQINRLIRALSGQLSRIETPVLAFNAAGDKTVDINSGRRLVKSLGSSLQIYQRVGPEAPHILTREGNPHREAMFRLVTDFIEGLEDAARTAREDAGKAP